MVLNDRQSAGLGLAATATVAQDAAPQGSNPLVMFGMMAVIFLIFWFMIIRPQQKQQKQRREMISALKNGDRIVTNGGLFATVKDVKADRFVVTIAEGVKVEISKSAITDVLQEEK